MIMDDNMEQELRNMFENGGKERDVAMMFADLMGSAIKRGLRKELELNPEDMTARKGLLGFGLVENASLMGKIGTMLNNMDEEEFVKHEQNLNLVVNTLLETAKELNIEV